MRLKAVKTEGGFLIPAVKGLENLEEIEVEILQPVNNTNSSIFTDDYIELHWKEILLNANRNIDVEDDEILPMAYEEYRNDKSTG